MKKTSWITRLEGSEFKIMRLREEATAKDLTLDTPERLVNFLKPKLPLSLRYSPDTENFGVVCLNIRRRPIGFEIVSNGTLDTLLVHPSSVFKVGIVMNASGLVLFHNHPSGDPTPSQADIRVTRDLVRAGQLMKIEIVDHIILGFPIEGQARDWVSMRELGLLL